MGKIVAIDFGLKRTGLAISDESQIFAFGLETVASEFLMEKLIALVKNEGVELIVLGLPKRLNDEDAHITENVRMLKDAIEKTIPLVDVVFEDERYTSKMASQSMHAAGATRKQKKNKGIVDMVSATIILQSYLESR